MVGAQATPRPQRTSRLAEAKGGRHAGQRSYGCLLYLARFYGFMIGVLAGIEALSNPFRLLPGEVGLSPHPKKPKRGRGN